MTDYPSFVQSRIKWLSTDAENLHHASTGLMGEAIELTYANSRENALEELGDLCFYKEHFRQAWIRARNFPPLYGLAPPLYNGHTHAGFSTILLLRDCGSLLDLTKKAWIYNKPLKGLQEDLEEKIDHIEESLNANAALLGVTTSQLQVWNQQKLQKRYPLGYSDLAAQERADKK
jgi:hypothetical protein